MKVTPAAAPRRRRPWLWNQSTSGLSASARKIEIRSQVRTCRATHQLEQQHDRDRERQDGENRRGAEADNALLHAVQHRAEVGRSGWRGSNPHN